MAHSALLFLLCFFRTSLAGFPNQINIGKLLFILNTYRSIGFLVFPCVVHSINPHTTVF